MSMYPREGINEETCNNWAIVTPIIDSANDVLRYEEDSLRAVVIASMNMGSNAVNAWWSIIFYSANLAPKFTVRCNSFGL